MIRFTQALPPTLPSNFLDLWKLENFEGISHSFSSNSLWKEWEVLVVVRKRWSFKWMFVRNSSKAQNMCVLCSSSLPSIVCKTQKLTSTDMIRMRDYCCRRDQQLSIFFASRFLKSLLKLSMISFLKFSRYVEDSKRLARKVINYQNIFVIDFRSNDGRFLRWHAL